MRLDRYDGSSFERGKSRIVEGLWYVISSIFVASWIPGSWLRVELLKLFGAQIGKGVLIKPRVRIKFPWKLILGDHVWIGEGVWVDNIFPISVGNHVCISQRVFLCSGNHDWRHDAFPLRQGDIRVGNQVWLGAGSSVAPGAVVADGVVLAIGSVATGKLSDNGVYKGVPAVWVCDRDLID